MKALPRAQDDIAHFDAWAAKFPKSPIEPEIQERMVMERAVIRRACRDLIAEGYALRLWDGEAWATERTQDVDAIMAAVHATDEDTLYVYKASDKTSSGWAKFSYLFLVYGNAGYEVIADHGTNIAEALKGTDAFVDLLADDPEGYETRVQCYEAMDMTRSDAQGVVDAEGLTA